MGNQFTIDCRICGSNVSLIEITNDDYECPTCHTIYHSEDGVEDRVLAEEMYQSYKGAKLAGLIKEEETQEEFYYG